MTRVVKSHRVSCMGTRGLSVTAPGAFKMRVSLHCLINRSVENRKKKNAVSFKDEGKITVRELKERIEKLMIWKSKYLAPVLWGWGARVGEKD